MVPCPEPLLRMVLSVTFSVASTEVIALPGLLLVWLLRSTVRLRLRVSFPAVIKIAAPPDRISPLFPSARVMSLML